MVVRVERARVVPWNESALPFHIVPTRAHALYLFYERKYITCCSLLLSFVALLVLWVVTERERELVRIEQMDWALLLYRTGS